MEDAAACNARLRKLEILEIFPIINDATNKRQRKTAGTNEMDIGIYQHAFIFFYCLPYFMYINR